jgi:hypothetical protein
MTAGGSTLGTAVGLPRRSLHASLARWEESGSRGLASLGTGQGRLSPAWICTLMRAAARRDDASEKLRRLLPMSQRGGKAGLLSRESSVSLAIQLTSQVLPPSAENACSKRQEVGVMSKITNRTRMARPFRVSLL